MIIKTYYKKDSGVRGQDPESWALNWGNTDFLAGAKAAEKSHLSPFFKKYFPRPPKKILDGGCGTGKYVYAYRNLGYDIIGVDFSEDLIRKIKKEIGPDIPVSRADVTRLPFEDGHFDCYYSGGVVEHFEDGPDRAIKEARRVLKKGGVLLATVPYVNPIRRCGFLFSREKQIGDLLQKSVMKCEIDRDPPEGFDFSAYYFDPSSFKPYLEKYGFSVEKVYPVDMLWGEIGQSLIAPFIRSGRKEKIAPAGDMEYGQRNALKRNVLKEMAYDFFVTEDRDNIFFKAPISLLNYLSGHMILLVARAV